MSDDIYRLVYYSRSEIKADAAGFAKEVAGILAASRRNNQRCGITGALMFSDGSFGQVLEGPRRAVETTFERIQRDPRHSEVSLLAFEPVASTAFAEWSMGYIGADRVTAAAHGGIADATGFNPARLGADALFETLHRLILEEAAV